MRYGIRRADDPLIVDSLKVVDHILKIDTPFGPCWRRYNHDGYGQQKDGGPFIHYGQGRAWPILTGERAHYELAAGGDVQPLVQAIEQFASVGGMLPEQVWDYKDMPDKGLYFGVPPTARSRWSGRMRSTSSCCAPRSTVTYSTASAWWKSDTACAR